MDDIRQISDHVTRDKKDDDPLERILEPWGVWRAYGVAGLSSPRKSPIAAVNRLETGKTDKLDLERYYQIRESLKPFYRDKKELRRQAYQAWKEWKSRVDGIVSRETKLVSVDDPKYGGHKRYSKIDQLLSTIHGPYYNILIRKYEDLWDKKAFMAHNNWTNDVTRQNISRARKAAREILKINGYKT